MIKQNIEDSKKTIERFDFPKDVIVETSAYCNLKCVMCPQPSMTRKRGYMTFSIFERIVDEIVDVSPSTNVWPAIMGEPLLDPGIVDKLNYACDMGINVCLNTNAVLLDSGIVKKVVDSGVGTFIIGLDAVCGSSYDKIRIGGDYLTVVKNVIGLVEYAKKTSGAKVIVQFIDMPENEGELETFKAMWLGLGCSVKVRPRLGWGTGVETSSLVIPDSERTFSCPWLTRTVSIHWDGSIAQCDADWDDKYNVGNINDSSIKEVWDGKLSEIREKHWNKDFNFEPCNSCKDWQAGRSYFYD